MSKQTNKSKVELDPDVPSISLSVTAKEDEKKEYLYKLNAKDKLSTEVVPEGKIQKKSKEVAYDIDESITHKVKNTQSKITEQEILLEVGQAKLSMKSNSIEISLGEVKVSLSSSGISIEGGSAVNVKGQAISFKGSSISGKASQTNFS